jgi:hypothetical protein
VLDGVSSNVSLVTSGVPQGSILGPMLFVYYINDMFKYITVDNIHTFLYADDTKLGMGIDGLDSCNILQGELDNLFKWSSDWGMMFNPSKCVYMSFCYSNPKINYTYKISNTPIDRVFSFNDLGVLVTHKLKWDEHINSCIKKANRRLGLVKRTVGYTCSSPVKLLCYTTLVRPLIEYSSQVWSCNVKKLIVNLESVQRRATKFILNDFSSPYFDRLNSLKLLPLALRREYLDLVYFFNCTHNLIDINMTILPTFIPTHRTRTGMDPLLLSNKLVKHTIYDKYYSCRISKLWNALPLYIRELETTPMGYNTSFKRELKLHLFNIFNAQFDDSNVCTWSLKCQCFNCMP